MSIPLARVLALLAAAALAHAAPAAGDEAPTIYKWIDEHGIAHYTTDRDRIPAALRNRVHQRPPQTPSAAAEPAPPRPAPSTPPAEVWVADPAPEVPMPQAASDAEPGPEAWAVRDVAVVPEDAPDGLDAGTAAELADVELEIAALESEIAADEEALKTLLSLEAAERSVPLEEDPAFREIAMRLPRLQADLRALEARRDQIAEP